MRLQRRQKFTKKIISELIEFCKENYDNELISQYFPKIVDLIKKYCMKSKIPIKKYKKNF